MMGTVPSGKGDAHLFLKVSVTFLVLLAAPAVHACDAVLEATVASSDASQASATGAASMAATTKGTVTFKSDCPL